MTTPLTARRRILPGSNGRTNRRESSYDGQEARNAESIPAHSCRLATRTNHPEMPLLPILIAGTLGAAELNEADQHASWPV
ncbi:hypothetical protein GCM10027074_31390 [Streptomyces deserti]